MQPEPVTTANKTNGNDRVTTPIPNASTITQIFGDETADIPAEAYKDGLLLAYPMAVESYNMAERRLDVTEKRLQDMLAFAVTITLAIVAFGVGKISANNLQSIASAIFFAAGIMCFLAGLYVGIRARLCGELRLISLTQIYKHYLPKRDAQFKLDFIRLSGKDNDENNRSIRDKAEQARRAALWFLFEMLCFGMWAVALTISKDLKGVRPTEIHPAEAAVPSVLPARPPLSERATHVQVR